MLCGLLYVAIVSSARMAVPFFLIADEPVAELWQGFRGSHACVWTSCRACKPCCVWLFFFFYSLLESSSDRSSYCAVDVLG